MVMVSEYTPKEGDKVVCIDWNGTMITCGGVYILKNLGSTLTTGNFVSTDRIRSYGFRFRKAYKNER